jgi:hypothetical protein
LFPTPAIASTFQPYFPYDTWGLSVRDSPFLIFFFLFPRPYLQPSDGSSPCDGASANRARRPHAGERELRRRGAERSTASPPIHRPPSLPIRRALRRIPSHLAARLARPGARRARPGALGSHGGARRGSRARKSTSRAANRTPGRANRALVERIELRQTGGWRSSRSRGGAGRGGSDGGAQGSGRPNLRPCAT